METGVAEFHLSYFDASMTEETRVRCERSARAYTEDIVSVLFRESTGIDELAEMLNRVSSIFVAEMAATRSCESDLDIEYADAEDRLREVSFRLLQVEDLCMREASNLANQHSCIFRGSQPLDPRIFLDFEEPKNYRKEMARSNPRAIIPPSGRATPLMRISNEAIEIPPMPSCIAFLYPDKENDVGNLVMNRNALLKEAKHDRATQESLKRARIAAIAGKRRRGASAAAIAAAAAAAEAEAAAEETPDSKRIAYKRDLRLMRGSLAHRLRAIRQMQLSCSVETWPQMSAGEIQLALMYCLYVSRAVRRMFCMHRHEMRAIEWYPLHPEKVYGFLCALNLFAERYHLGEINAANLLHSMRHMHTFGFATSYTDVEIAGANKSNL